MVKHLVRTIAKNYVTLELQKGVDVDSFSQVISLRLCVSVVNSLGDSEPLQPGPDGEPLLDF
jgi:hypothetical protein